MIFKKRVVQQELGLQVYFVCDAGMGSSAMGASLLQSKLKQEKGSIRVRNAAIDEIPCDVDVIIAHLNFTQRIKKEHPNVKLFEINNFMDVSQYGRIVEDLMLFTKKKKEILKAENIILNCESCSSEEAIKNAGTLLVRAGYVTERYIDGMLKRNASLSTYIGNDIAIPHGEYDVKEEVIQTGIVVMTYPKGLCWDGNLVRIVIGIAACNDDHMSILANIANKLGDMAVVEEVVHSQDPRFVFQILTSEEDV